MNVRTEPPVADAAGGLKQLPIFVVNLRASTARREHIRAQLDRLGLGYELVHEPPGQRVELTRIVAAAQQRQPSTEEAAIVDGEAIRAHPDWLTPGAIGATLSHNAIHRRIVEEQIPYALILEDDVVLSPGVAAIARHLGPFEEIARDSVLLLIGITQSSSRIMFSAESAVSANGLTAYRIADPETRIGCSSTYIVSAATSARILDFNSPVTVTCDSWPHFRNAGACDDIYAFLPAPVRPALFPSELGYRSRDSRTASVIGAMNTAWPTRRLLRLRRYLNWKRRTRYGLR